MMSEPTALFERDGSTYTPTGLTMGPWRPDAQHGGPPSGLLMFLCEQQVESDETIARITVNLMASVPLEALTATVTRQQVSRRVSHIEATLQHQNRTVAAATALILAKGQLPSPGWTPEPPTVPPWDQVESIDPPNWAAPVDGYPFHRFGVEHRFVDGIFGGVGPAVDWIRLRVPVVAGTEPSGFQRVLSSVDLGSGISAVYEPSSKVGMINADLDVAFVGEPEGEWFCLDSVTHIGSGGTGTAISHVYQQDRLVGLATQCLLGTAYPST